MTVTKMWKVYGYDGHRQRESFFPSYAHDWSNEYDGCRIVSVMNSDITGTNDYTIVRITRDTADDCFDELSGQLSDGIFENSRTGNIVECCKHDFDFHIPGEEEMIQSTKQMYDEITENESGGIV